MIDGRRFMEAFFRKPLCSAQRTLRLRSDQGASISTSQPPQLQVSLILSLLGFDAKLVTSTSILGVRACAQRERMLPSGK